MTHDRIPRESARIHRRLDDSWESECESQLLVSIRRFLVIMDRIRDEVHPAEVAHELRLWELSLRDSLKQYEQMMGERP